MSVSNGVSEKRTARRIARRFLSEWNGGYEGDMRRALVAIAEQEIGAGLDELIAARTRIATLEAERDAALSDVARLKTERDEARGKALEEAAHWQRTVDLFAPALAMMARCDHDVEGPCEDCIRGMLTMARERALAAPAAKGGAT